MTWRAALRRVAMPLVAVVAVGLLAVGGMAVIGDDDPTSNADRTSQESGDVGSDNDRDDGAAAVEGASAPASDEPIRIATAESPLYDARPEEIPLEVELSDAAALDDGEVVTIRVVPEGGATEVYGFTAFLCRGDVDITVDAQARPTNFGWCAAAPLSPGTDSFLEVAAEPPYQVAEGQFRVGVGSSTFTTRDGDEVTVTCGPDDPCQLVLKLQFPNGYGLRSYPLTFR